MKRLFLIRGLPGSGKTTLAHLLEAGFQARGEEVISLATDEYFVDASGEYNFEPNELTYAHEWCQERAEAFLKKDDVDSVIVHNTFSQPWEARPYIDMAEKHGYEVFIVETQNDFGSIHGVPEKVVDSMEARWLPLS